MKPARGRARGRIPAAALFVVLALAACGDQGTGPADGGSPAVASVVVAPSDTHVAVGGTVTLTATLLDDAGHPLSGREVVWSSADEALATVDGGVVTGRRPGEVEIRATSEGRTGSAAVVVDPTPGLVVVGGDHQTGLSGWALADSLMVRVSDGDGAPVAGAPVTWSASQGTVSPAATITGADGTARGQWTVGERTGAVTVATPGGTPVVFTATGRTPGDCRLVPGAQIQRFSLGPTDFTLSLDATREIHIVVLFVDFRDAPSTGSEDPATLTNQIVTPGLALLGELSYGRASVTATPVPTWYRMSGSIGSYSWTTYAGHKTYITEAMTLADADVDFSQFDAVYIFTPPSTAQPVSPTFNGGQTAGVVFDGRTIGNAVTFGLDARTYGPSILAHETGHMFGLVDLYAYDPNGGDPFRGNQFRFTGSWSLMADVFRPGHYFAWEKRKLGWLEPSQLGCLEAGEGVEVVLDPVETPGGVKMVAMPTGPSTAIVAEVRRLTGLDAHLCSEGVLLYDVDARVPSGMGPLRIRGSRQTGGACGPWSDATFDLGPDGVGTLNVPDTVDMHLLGVDEDGRYRVRFKR